MEWVFVSIASLENLTPILFVAVDIAWDAIVALWLYRRSYERLLLAKVGLIRHTTLARLHQSRNLDLRRLLNHDELRLLILLYLAHWN